MTQIGLLRLIVGELERANCTKEQQELAVIRKLVTDNNETLLSMPESDERYSKLKNENVFFESLLPKLLPIEEIRNLLLTEEIVSRITTAKNDGQAMGEAMKHLKGKSVNGKDVEVIVKEIRGKTS
jgi:uncharacterized protein YqeY